jgi:hypothetical protein
MEDRVLNYKVLEVFCEYRNYAPYMSQPNVVNGIAFGTNAHILGWFPKERVVKFDNHKKLNNIDPSAIIPHDLSLIASYKVSQIKECYDIAPKYYEDGFCKACNGNGSVTADFFYLDKTYEIDGECPICDGEGSSGREPGDKVPQEYVISILGSCFSYINLPRMIKAAELLNVDDIDIVYQKNKKSFMVFKIGDLHVMMAAINMDDSDRKLIVLHTI